MIKFLKIIGVLIVLFILLITGFWGWFKYEESSYSTSAVSYIKTTLPMLSETWDIEVFKANMTPEALNASPDADLQKLLNWFKKLGPLESFEEPELGHVFKGFNGNGKYKILTYNIKARFEKGDANITLRLSDLGSEQFKIQALNINSKALLD